MALVLGLNAKTYVLSIDPNHVLPNEWLEVIYTRDETLNLTTALADVTTRAAKGWRLQVGTLTEGTIDGQILYDTADPVFEMIQNAFFTKTLLDMAFMDGPIDDANSEGLVGGFMVTNFTIGRQLEEAMMVDVSYTATNDSEGLPPEWLSGPVTP